MDEPQIWSAALTARPSNSLDASLARRYHAQRASLVDTGTFDHAYWHFARLKFAEENTNSGV
jgi:hypothetical protein